MTNIPKEFAKRFVLPHLSEELRFRLRFRYKIGYWPSIEQPRSMIEKIFWLIKFDRSPIRRMAADRVAIRDFVAERSPRCKAPAHLWTGTTLTEQDWARLPRKFVLKANHGSQMVLLVDKQVDTYESVCQRSSGWMATDYSVLLDEWVYKDVPHLLIAEERLEIDGAVPSDWKFFCGNGRVIMIVLDLDRFGDHRRNLYRRDFTQIMGAKIAYEAGEQVEKPAALDKAIAIAEELAAPFDFIRVDLYILGNDIYFGELTNFPAAGWDAIEPASLDFELGSMVTLCGSGTSQLKSAAA